ncbi:hypothetical protein EVAR_8887_1 [Eumeta japonica]|uniref:Uncharacterized protein n=1 Tax=Eumeta variegata TaxID=151549 RepID=A0A4C1U0H1_EUMVA|nr:hypothetical protein EVAR_8887_1 [Eumeta japonica]
MKFAHKRNSFSPPTSTPQSVACVYAHNPPAEVSLQMNDVASQGAEEVAAHENYDLSNILVGFNRAGAFMSPRRALIAADKRHETIQITQITLTECVWELAARWEQSAPGRRAATTSRSFGETCHCRKLSDENRETRGQYPRDNSYTIDGRSKWIISCKDLFDC